MNQLALDDKMMSPTHDLVFKSLFTRDCKESKIVLMDLISSVIGVKVENVELKENELAKNDINEKQERLDINCTINDGELINIPHLTPSFAVLFKISDFASRRDSKDV